MSEQTISYAKSSAEWLRGMNAHIKYGSQDWIVDRATIAASELENCITEITVLRARLEKAEAELGEDKRDLLLEIGGLQAALRTARNLALKEAESVIEARISIYTEIGQLNALRECLSSIRALKSSPPTPDQGDGA